MDSMEDFEGIKRIKNVNDLTINSIYELLKNYAKAIGTLKISDDNMHVIGDTEGKYYIDIYLNSGSIVIERKLEEGFENENYSLGEGAKSVDMSIADRMIEQIYDFFKDFFKNDGNVSEFITGVKRVLHIKEEKAKFSKVYNAYDADDKLLFQMKDNKFTKEFVVKNVVAKREVVSVKYADMDNNRFSILKPPYTTIYLIKNELENKTTFSGTLNGDDIKIKADYSDNHYLIEVDEIVVGAIDTLDADKRDSYRVEINDYEYEYLVLALTIIIDLYAEKVKYENIEEEN